MNIEQHVKKVDRTYHFIGITHTYELIRCLVNSHSHRHTYIHTYILTLTQICALSYFLLCKQRDVESFWMTKCIHGNIWGKERMKDMLFYLTLLRKKIVQPLAFFLNLMTPCLIWLGLPSKLSLNLEQGYFIRL